MELPRQPASRRALHRAVDAGFTLMELMVVVGIILIMTAMSIPAITKFLDGQSLHQSGRITQSAFNEARRASITQRSKNYLILFREPDPGRPGMYIYGMRR
ncbi:prepilin-type N-terminal cleavage/methylation domain-containing protein, partial [Planctomycetota bacterium]|nr:prepilin-type N-terminal cleavage/methylation domain-containing protein [Planctomycetota bacterium]